LQDCLFHWHVNKLYHTCSYNSLPEDEPSGLKHVEDIVKIKILVYQRCILLAYIIQLIYTNLNLMCWPPKQTSHSPDIYHFVQQIQLRTEGIEKGDLGAVARGSGGSCNMVQEISFHIVKFS